jgi:hypothetical protein
MMKRLFFFMVFALLSIPVFQQSAKVLNYQIVDLRKLHFGFTIGLNSFDFNFKRSAHSDTSTALAQVVHLEPGFNVNVVSELRLNEDFALRFLPGLVFGQRRITFLKKSTNYITDFGSIDVESNYLDFPILIKYKSKRLYNFRPYLIAGASIRYDMAAKKNPKLDQLIDGQEVSVKMKPFDTYLELGYGMDFYLTYFKFSTEIKLSLGTRNINDSNLASSGISGFTSKLVIINFHFE